MEVSCGWTQTRLRYVLNFSEGRVMLIEWKEYALAKLREETKAYPELQDFDDEESGRDGGSTAPISSVGTPMPGGSGCMYPPFITRGIFI
jgi:hypothetical protein